MTQYEYRAIAIDKIITGTPRIRGERALRIEALAADIKANGQLQPILVVELEDGSFDLDDGFLRVQAIRALKVDTIDARVTPRAAIKPEEQRLRGLMANLNRDDYTALERAEALCALKADYEVLYPEAKKGGDYGNQYKSGKKSLNEIFSFSQKAAEMMGVDRRSIELAIALAKGLSDDTKERVRGTLRIRTNYTILRA